MNPSKLYKYYSLFGNSGHTATHKYSPINHADLWAPFHMETDPTTVTKRTSPLIAKYVMAALVLDGNLKPAYQLKKIQTLANIIPTRSDVLDWVESRISVTNISLTYLSPNLHLTLPAFSIISSKKMEYTIEKKHMFTE